MKGYGGNILRINLTTRKATLSPTPTAWLQDFLGGRGLVARAIWEEIPAGVDPLGPENKLIMASGPLSGQFLSSSGKLHMGCISPTTGGYGDSNMGGHLSLELKQAGIDLLILEGKADRPITLVIENGAVRFVEASHIWEKDTFDSERQLKEELGEAYQIMVIGPAAVNGVLYACIQHDFGRQAGRTGVGTVMGAKRVKAIAVTGDRDIPLHDPRRALATGEKMMNLTMSQPGFVHWQPYGTPEVVPWANSVGAMPTRNFQTGTIEGYDGLSGPSMKAKVTEIDKGCTCCAIPCGKWGKGRLGEKSMAQEGPEYESIALLGGTLGINDISVVAYLNGLCDKLGLDSISAGNCVGWVMECYEKGYLAAEEIGRPVRFGDGEAAAWLLEQIAYGKGFGRILGQGVRYASTQVGRGTQRFAMQIKGLEISGYECRYAPAMLLSYMTCDVGGHHNRSWAITFDIATGRDNLEGKAERVVWLQHVRPLFDALGCCRFPWVEAGIPPEGYADLLEPITGRPYTWEELLTVSERIWNLTRMISLRHVPGFGRALDYPPARWMEEGATSGPAQGKHFTREQIDRLLDRYYEIRGWSRDGIPSPETLDRLGLSFCAPSVR